MGGQSLVANSFFFLIRMNAGVICAFVNQFPDSENGWIALCVWSGVVGRCVCIGRRGIRSWVPSPQRKPSSVVAGESVQVSGGGSTLEDPSGRGVKERLSARRSLCSILVSLSSPPLPLPLWRLEVPLSTSSLFFSLGT